jgi:signal transduction histidine kinase
MATIERSEKSDSQLNRRMYQMLRIIGNMSDAVRFAYHDGPQEYVDAVALVREIFDRASAYAETAGFTLQLSAPTAPIYTLANRDLLERAIYNLLSNAMKFSPSGTTISVGLTQQGNRLCLTFDDPGRGIDRQVQSSLFQRYQRQPGLEDPSYGLGLGMTLVRLAAAAHGGTVLIDHPKQTGTRVTLTIKVQQNPSNTLRSPVLRVDYAGERDHCLLELSETLPSYLYKSE